MEINPQAAKLQGRRENNLCLSGNLEIRVMTFGQSHDTPLGYKEHFYFLWNSIRMQLNYKAEGKTMTIRPYVLLCFTCCAKICYLPHLSDTGAYKITLYMYSPEQQHWWS